MNKKFEDVIAEQGRLIYTNVGDSMEPVIREGNLLIIEAVKKPLKVGDVPLYKRDSGQYVLHRIVKIRRGEYTMKGDNRTALEKGITDRHIIGVLTGIVRNGKTYPVETAQEYLARESGLAPAQPKGIKAKLKKTSVVKIGDKHERNKLKNT